MIKPTTARLLNLLSHTFTLTKREISRSKIPKERNVTGIYDRISARFPLS